MVYTKKEFSKVLEKMEKEVIQSIKFGLSWYEDDQQLYENVLNNSFYDNSFKTKKVSEEEYYRSLEKLLSFSKKIIIKDFLLLKDSNNENIDFFNKYYQKIQTQTQIVF